MSMFQDVYNELYANKAVRIEFDTEQGAQDYIKNLRVFKSRQDVLTRNLGMMGIETTLSTKVERSEEGGYAVSLEFIASLEARKKQGPKYTIIERQEPVSQVLQSGGE